MESIAWRPNTVIGCAIRCMIKDWVAALSNAQERTNRKRMNRKQMPKQTQMDCFVMYTALTRGRSDEVYGEDTLLPIR